MNQQFEARVEAELNEIREAGLWKEERIIVSPQGADIRTTKGPVVNFCANNYLGLANDPGLKAGGEGDDRLARLGLASVRFICGTQDAHKTLEKGVGEVPRHRGHDPLLVVLRRQRRPVRDPDGRTGRDHQRQPEPRVDHRRHPAQQGAALPLPERRHGGAGTAPEGVAWAALADDRDRRRVLDGRLHRQAADICELAEKYKAIVMVDDSHATGFFGPTGRGTPEFHGVQSRIDVMTSTLGKALGGAPAASRPARRRSSTCCATAAARTCSRTRWRRRSSARPSPASTDAVGDHRAARQAGANTKFFREAMTKAGFAIVPGEHPICPIMLGDAKLASRWRARMLRKGVYVIGFCFPVVPKGKARIRVQISAAHSFDQIDRAAAAFTKVGRAMGVVK
jgi:glycine C-acetyltransferase